MAKEETVGPISGVAKAAEQVKSEADSMMIEIEDKAHIESCLESDKLVVVMVKAKWCRLCASMK